MSQPVLVYDGACGTGGMLTVAEERLSELAHEHGKEVTTHLFGQEINPETYAITKADLILKGEGAAADNMKYNSTLSADAFVGREFDFMLSNPPYGKSWKTDLERMGGKGDMRDPRFIISHAAEPEYRLITRSSDGQLMFLVNMLSKMKHSSRLGSRIAEVHNGSSLFTGDAGQGESNIRRWIIENDWLEAIIALPLNMFYNTGIATYVWVLSNRKPEHRQGRVQLIDATTWFKALHKNLGSKNCELAPDDIHRVMDTFLTFQESEQSKIFPNEAFGYYKVTVERPLRLSVDVTEDSLARFRAVCYKQEDTALSGVVDSVVEVTGKLLLSDYNAFIAALETDWRAVKLTAKRLKLIRDNLTTLDEQAAPVIKRVHKPGRATPDPLHGLFETIADGKPAVVEYEADPEGRDSEQVPLLEEGGIEAFFRREVLPYVQDAWIAVDATKIGYEISFTRYFYKPQPLRTLEEIAADIEALEKETEGLLGDILVEVGG